MAIDTQGLASIGEMGGFDPTAAKGKALSIKDMMDREQLSKLQVGQAKQDSATNTKVQALLKGEGVDYSNPEGVMRTAEKLNKISPKAALEFQTQAQKFSSGKVQSQIDQYELLDHQQGVIVSAIDPIVAQARAMKNKGADDMTVNAFIAQQLPGAIQTLQNTKLPNGQSALSPEVIQQINAATKQGPMSLATIEGFEAKSKAGQAQIKQRLEQLKADTSVKKEGETERHNQAMEANAAANTGIRKERALRDEHGNLTPDAIDLAAQRLANGEKAQDVLANFGRGKQGGQDIAAVQNRFATIAKEQGMTPDEIALRQQEMRGSARAELALGEREGKIAPRVQEAKTFAQIALKASDDVPRGDWKSLSKMLQFGADQSSDPKLGKFQAANVSLINAYAAAIGGGQIHQHDQEVGANLLSTANGPENYKAKVEQLIIETEAALKAPEQVKEQWRQTREQDSESRRPAKPGQPPHPGQTPPVAGNEPTATGPDGKKVVFRNGQWVPLG